MSEAHPPGSVTPRDLLIKPYGELVRSADCPEIEIPESFHCVRLSSGGVASTVRPGFTVPNAFDGMAAFPLPNGNVRLIRNHEMIDDADTAQPIGQPAYGRQGEQRHHPSLEVRISGSDGDLTAKLVDEFVSLAGTRVNCAGGPTPWGSWLSCEEITSGVESGFEKPHGYVFEVPAEATGPVDPVPLRAMGRFIHEAVAIDPATGIVYETEDTWYVPGELPGAGFYRFIPNRPGVLAAGGGAANDGGDRPAGLPDGAGTGSRLGPACPLGGHRRSRPSGRRVQRAGGLQPGTPQGCGSFRAP